MITTVLMCDQLVVEPVDLSRPHELRSRIECTAKSRPASASLVKVLAERDGWRVTDGSHFCPAHAKPGAPS